jgi:hypothetical protein
MIAAPDLRVSPHRIIRVGAAPLSKPLSPAITSSKPMAGFSASIFASASNPPATVLTVIGARKLGGQQFDIQRIVIDDKNAPTCGRLLGSRLSLRDAV